MTDAKYCAANDIPAEVFDATRIHPTKVTVK
jgi:hypothetical protein